MLSLPDPSIPTPLPALCSLPASLCFWGAFQGCLGQECHFLILFLSLTWERCPSTEHHQVSLCVPSAAWKSGMPRGPGEGSGIAPSCTRSFPCTRGAHRQLSLGCSHFHFLPLCVSVTENPRLVWGGGTLVPPLWMFQYSSSSSFFPFPVVPVSSSTNNPPFWGLLGKICAEG